MYAPALLVRGRRAEPLVNCYILFIGKQNKYLLINKYIKNLWNNLEKRVK